MSSPSYVVLSSKQFNADIVFYGHNLANRNVDAVFEVLSSTDRIGDPSYLTAQIVYALFNEAFFVGDIGCGISTDDGTSFFVGDYPTVRVDLDRGRYFVDDREYDRWGKEVSAE